MDFHGISEWVAGHLVWVFVLLLVWEVWHSLATAGLFRKLDIPAWKAWVPLLREAELLRAAQISPWWVLVPGVGAVMTVMAFNSIADSMGYGTGMTVLFVFFPTIALSVVGFASTQELPVSTLSSSAYYGITSQGMGPPKASQPWAPAAYSEPPPATFAPPLPATHYAPTAMAEPQTAVPQPFTIPEPLSIPEPLKPIQSAWPVATPEPELPTHTQMQTVFRHAPLDDRTMLSESVGEPSPTPRYYLIFGDRHVEINAPEVVLGRAALPDELRPNAQIVQITDQKRTVSKRHALIRCLPYDYPYWFITDLNSTNGVTLVGDDGSHQRLAAGVEVPMTQRFYLGDVEIYLVAEEA